MGAGPGMGNVSAEYQKKLTEDWELRERERAAKGLVSLDDPDLNALALYEYMHDSSLWTADRFLRGDDDKGNGE